MIDIAIGITLLSLVCAFLFICTALYYGYETAKNAIICVVIVVTVILLAAFLIAKGLEERGVLSYESQRITTTK